MDIALLFARLLFGLGMAGHAVQKLFGWFGGPGIAGAGAIFEKLGFRPGRFSRCRPRSASSPGPR
jgi:putative oxidoreductase